MRKYKKLINFVRVNGVNYNSIILLFATTLVSLKMFDAASNFYSYFYKKGYDIKLLRSYFQFSFHIVWDTDAAMKACRKMLTKPRELNQYDYFYIILLAGSTRETDTLKAVIGNVDKKSSLYYYALAAIECINEGDFVSRYVKCYSVGIEEYAGNIPEWVEHSSNFILDYHHDEISIDKNIHFDKPNSNSDYFILMSADEEYFCVYVDRIISLLRLYGNYQKIYFLIVTNEGISERTKDKISEMRSIDNNIEVIEEYVTGNIGLQSSLVRYTRLQKYIAIEKCTALILDIDTYVDMNFQSIADNFLNSGADVAFWDTLKPLPWSRYTASIAFIPYSKKAFLFLNFYKQYVDSIYKTSHPAWTLDQTAVYYAFNNYSNTYSADLLNYNIGDHQKRISIKLLKLKDDKTSKHKDRIKNKYINRMKDI